MESPTPARGGVGVGDFAFAPAAGRFPRGRRPWRERRARPGGVAGGRGGARGGRARRRLLRLLSRRRDARGHRGRRTRQPGGPGRLGPGHRRDGPAGSRRRRPLGRRVPVGSGGSTPGLAHRLRPAGPGRHAGVRGSGRRRDLLRAPGDLVRALPGRGAAGLRPPRDRRRVRGPPGALALPGSGARHGGARRGRLRVLSRRALDLLPGRVRAGQRRLRPVPGARRRPGSRCSRPRSSPKGWRPSRSTAGGRIASSCPSSAGTGPGSTWRSGAVAGSCRSTGACWPGSPRFLPPDGRKVAWIATRPERAGVHVGGAP